MLPARCPQEGRKNSCVKLAHVKFIVYLCNRKSLLISNYMKQMTLKGSFTLCGKGLHTGLSLTVTFNPAPENHGYKIQRID